MIFARMFKHYSKVYRFVAGKGEGAKRGKEFFFFLNPKNKKIINPHCERAKTCKEKNKETSIPPILVETKVGRQENDCSPFHRKMLLEGKKHVFTDLDKERLENKKTFVCTF